MDQEVGLSGFRTNECGGGTTIQIMGVILTSEPTKALPKIS